MSSLSMCSPLSPRRGQGGVRRKMQLVAICGLLLVASLTGTRGQSRRLTHHISNRNSNIDSAWYVGRGVRPIGRFGKRQNVGGSSPGAPENLAWILNALRERNAMDSDQQPEGEVLY